jgi:molecular chaperone DnaK
VDAPARAAEGLLEAEPRRLLDVLALERCRLHDRPGTLEDVVEADAKAAEEAIAAARKAVEEGGQEKIERAVQDLTKASHKLAETLYQKTQAPPSGGGDGGPAGEKKADGGDVIDAEVVDKK